MPMFNLLEFSKNHSETTERSNDEIKNYRDVANNSKTDLESFKFKRKIIRSTANNRINKDVKIVALIKYLYKF